MTTRSAGSGLITQAGALVVLACLLVCPARAQAYLPDPAATPGATNPAVTQANIATTICVRGWTRTIRPPREFTSAVKRRQLRSWSYRGGRMRDYEEDHLIPLELGGSPDDLHNLWPQPRLDADGWGADRKDDLERVLNRLVCSGRMPLALAQRTMARDWVAAYRMFLSSQ